MLVLPVLLIALSTSASSANADVCVCLFSLFVMNVRSGNVTAFLPSVLPSVCSEKHVRAFGCACVCVNENERVSTVD